MKHNTFLNYLDLFQLSTVSMFQKCFETFVRTVSLKQSKPPYLFVSGTRTGEDRDHTVASVVVPPSLVRRVVRDSGRRVESPRVVIGTPARSPDL